MTFAQKMQDVVNKGLAASRDLASKAGEKAKDLGAMGALKLEILRLQSHAEKLIAKLGTEVYAALVDGNQPAVSRDTPSIRDILKEIEDIRKRVESKENEYRAIGGKEDL